MIHNFYRLLFCYFFIFFKKALSKTEYLIFLSWQIFSLAILTGVFDRVGGLHTLFFHTDFFYLHSHRFLQKISQPAASFYFFLLLGTDLSHTLSVCLLSDTECENVPTTRVVLCCKDEEPTAWIKRLSWADVCVRQNASVNPHCTQNSGERTMKKVLFFFYSFCLLATSVLDSLYNLQRNDDFQVLCNSKSCTESWINERSHTLWCRLY